MATQLPPEPVPPLGPQPEPPTGPMPHPEPVQRLRLQAAASTAGAASSRPTIARA